MKIWSPNSDGQAQRISADMEGCRSRTTTTKLPLPAASYAPDGIAYCCTSSDHDGGQAPVIAAIAWLRLSKKGSGARYRAKAAPGTSAHDEAVAKPIIRRVRSAMNSREIEQARDYRDVSWPSTRY